MFFHNKNKERDEPFQTFLTAQAEIVQREIIQDENKFLIISEFRTDV